MSRSTAITGAVGVRTFQDRSEAETPEKQVHNPVGLEHANGALPGKLIVETVTRMAEIVEEAERLQQELADLRVKIGLPAELP